jgi:spore germination protein
MLVVSLVFLTSCWDRTEIEDVGFVLATALDPVEDEDELARKYEEETGKPVPDHMFQMTAQVVVPGQLQPESGGQGQPFFNIRASGLTNFKTNRNFASRRSRGLGFDHLKVLLINEELARQGIIDHLIDFYSRDHVMRTNILVFISDGKGYEILKNKLPLEIMPAISIRMINENAKRGHQIPNQKKIGDLKADVINKRSYIIPKISEKKGKDLNVSGAAVFQGHTNKMIGWLNDYDIEGYEWIVGEKENAVMDAFYGKDQQPFTFETDFSKSTIKYEKGKNTFHVEIHAEGFFVDNWIDHINIDSQKTIGKLEQAVEKEIENQAKKIIKKMQEEYYADIFEFYKEIKKSDYTYWQEIKENWDGEDGLFTNADITVKAKVKIRHYMTIEQLEEE